MSKNEIKGKILRLTTAFLKLFPPDLLAYVYVVLLAPKPLKSFANGVICSFIGDDAVIKGVKIALNKKDPVVSGGVVLGVYEDGEISLLRDKLAAGMTVIDAGANIGYFTAVAADIVGQSGRVISFEPDPENRFFLEKTVKLNNFNNVEICDGAVADRPGKGRLYLSEVNKGDHRIFSSRDDRDSVGISITTIDDYLEQKKIKKVDFIKLDVQGAEALALEGAKNILTRCEKINLVIEFWPYGLVRAGSIPIKMLEKLDRQGFKIYKIRGSRAELELLRDFDSLVRKCTGTKYVNLYCCR